MLCMSVGVYKANIKNEHSLYTGWSNIKQAFNMTRVVAD